MNRRKTALVASAASALAAALVIGIPLVSHSSALDRAGARMMTGQMMGGGGMSRADMDDMHDAMRASMAGAVDGDVLVACDQMHDSMGTSAHAQHHASRQP